MLLYDLTSTYFETDLPRSPEDLRQYGYSRDKRADCRQVVIALIVTPEGSPLSCEVLAGNTTDSTMLCGFLERIEARYGKANRIWVMDRGVPTEASLGEDAFDGRAYLVGTHKGRLTKLEQRKRASLPSPGSRCARASMSSALTTTKTPYVLAQSAARVDKERPMRRKRLRRYVSPPAGPCRANISGAISC